MGYLVKNGMKYLYERIRDATTQSLESLRERFRDASQVDSPLGYSPYLRLVVRKYL